MKLPKPRKLSSGNYFIQLRLDGQSIPITARTATECTNQARLIKAEYLAGVKEERLSAKDEQTLQKIIEDYMTL